MPLYRKPSVALTLADIDRLTSITATAGDTLIFTSSGTINTLSWTRSSQSLLFSGGIKATSIIATNTLAVSGTSTLSGHTFIGAGTGPDPAARTDALLTLAEDASDATGTLRHGLYIVPVIDEDLAGGDFDSAQYNILVGSGLESTDGDTVTSREHWNSMINGDTAPDGFSAVEGANWFSQTFTTGATRHYISSVMIEVYGAGSPGTITVQIKAVDGASKPTGAVLSTGTYSTAITTDPAGEAIYVSMSKFLPSAATQYAILVSQSASTPNDVNWLSESAAGYASGVAWSSADSGATWASVAVDYMFAIAGVQATTTNSIRMHYVQLGGTSGGTKIGTFAKVTGFDIALNPTFPAGVATTNLVGYDLTTLATSAVASRSYGLRIQSAGNGTIPWAGLFVGDTQINATSKLLLGGTATVKATQYWLQRSSGFITGAIASTNVVELSATAWYPITNGGPTLGQNGQGWKSLICKDTAAAFETTLQFTSASIAADSTLTVDLGTNSPTISILGTSKINQDVQTTGTPQHARLGLGVAADGTALIKLAAGDVLLDTTTGTKIGTATNEKLAFHASTPVIQRAGAAQASVATTAATNIAPFGYTTAAQADAIVTLVNEIRAALVEKGLLKGSA